MSTQTRDESRYMTKEEASAPLTEEEEASALQALDEVPDITLEDLRAVMREEKTETSDIRRTLADLHAATRAPVPPVDPDDLAERSKEALLRLEANDAALRQFNARRAGEQPPVVPETLADLLARPREVVKYRVDRLWSVNGRVLFSAQYKAGKTTTAINLVRSLVDGEPFLEEFEAASVSRVAVLDFEMDSNDLAEEYERIGVHHADRVDLYALRGNAGAFNILDDDVRREWADRLRGVDVVILDCLSTAASVFGIDENDNTAMGQYLGVFDTLLNEAGVGEAVVIHHTGHDGKRGRGASKILAWGDQLWLLRLDDPDNPTSQRFFKAWGRRRVDVRERGLKLDPDTNLLTFDESATVLVKGVSNAEVLAALKHLKEHPKGVSKNALLTAMGLTKGSGTYTKITRMESAGLIRIEPGAGKTMTCTITENGKEVGGDAY